MHSVHFYPLGASVQNGDGVSFRIFVRRLNHRSFPSVFESILPWITWKQSTYLAVLITGLFQQGAMQAVFINITLRKVKVLVFESSG